MDQFYDGFKAVLVKIITEARSLKSLKIWFERSAGDNLVCPDMVLGLEYEVLPRIKHLWLHMGKKEEVFSPSELRHWANASGWDDLEELVLDRPCDLLVPMDKVPNLKELTLLPDSDSNFLEIEHHLHHHATDSPFGKELGIIRFYLHEYPMHPLLQGVDNRAPWCFFKHAPDATTLKVYQLRHDDWLANSYLEKPSNKAIFRIRRFCPKLRELHTDIMFCNFSSVMFEDTKDNLAKIAHMRI
jgi:hypothetical protein